MVTWIVVCLFTDTGEEMASGGMATQGGLPPRRHREAERFKNQAVRGRRTTPQYRVQQPLLGGNGHLRRANLEKGDEGDVPSILLGHHKNGARYPRLRSSARLENHD